MSKEDFMRNNLQPGEKYAGLILSQSGDYHVMLLPGELMACTWHDAQIWAALAGGELPTRNELRLALMNVPDAWSEGWYWTSEMCLDRKDCAYVIDSVSLGQDFDGLLYNEDMRAFAIRRIPF